MSSSAKKSGARASRRGGCGGATEGDSDGYESSQHEVVEHHYKRPKPRTVTSAIFMWERIAAFSQPAEVAELEHVSRDVAQHLKASNTGTHLMQRYWNAQWSRLLWKEEELPEEKRYLASSMLTRSDGKRSWKKAFVEEYPHYLERVLQGTGMRNNAVNEAKVLFHREALNAPKTAAELARLELTAEEARLKEQRKRGVDVEFEDPDHANGAASPSSPHAHGPAHVSKEERERHEKGRPRATVKAANEAYTRDDYKEDYRNGARKGKHKKGGTAKWSNFDNFGDYNY